MKYFVFVVLALAGVASGAQNDDGRYRPELYGGDDGKYRHSGDGRYNGDGRYGGARFGGFASASQPVVSLLGPSNFNSVGLNPFASSASAVSVARPSAAFVRASADAYARILRQDQDQDINAYHYLYQTENGISAEETGRIDPSPADSGTKARGFYEYTGDDGVRYRVDYVADENGFQPSGAHLPR